MSDFFKRKVAKGVPRPEVKLQEFGEYDFSKDDTIMACGLTTDTTEFKERNTAFVEDMLVVSSGGREGNKTALIAESVEAHFSTREMAFLLSKFMVNDLINQVKQDSNGK
tara:strand:+ start:174 stop:503 length:330 start_codon:yes stop_codon:yes gene_type:complete